MAVASTSTRPFKRWNLSDYDVTLCDLTTSAYQPADECTTSLPTHPTSGTVSYSGKMTGTDAIFPIYAASSESPSQTSNDTVRAPRSAVGSPVSRIRARLHGGSGDEEACDRIALGEQRFADDQR